MVGINKILRLAYQTAVAYTRGSVAAPFDILVIGSGATGCCVALDAATRGLRVGLVERDNYSAGTSSRSTKLVHEACVRYLEKAFWQFDYGQLKLVFHALEERAHILQNAPQLCNALPTMTPCYEWWEVLYYRAGLKLYDLMNDSQLNVAIACTAALVGAVVLNHAEAISLKKDEVTGNVTGAHIHNKLTGNEFDVHAKVVINATGPFCDEVQKMADKSASQMISPSGRVHIVLPDYYSPDHMGLVVPKTKDGRVVFMLPWLGRTVAGATDSATTLTMHLEAHEEEIEFILDAISDYLVVKGTDTALISRDHVVCLDLDGLVTVTGGKWTTYKSMAEDAVNVAIKSGSLQPTNGVSFLKSSYFWLWALPLIGVNGWNPSSFTSLAQNYVCMKRAYSGKIVPGPMDTAAAKHLVQTYGGLAPHVALIAQACLSQTWLASWTETNTSSGCLPCRCIASEALVLLHMGGLGKRLAHGYPYLEAEVAYCARTEYCESAVDFIARRARLAFLETDVANRASSRVIEILTAEHRWDKAQKKAAMVDVKAFLETFKSSKNAQFADGKHRAR
ncbi:unnamed protein product [Sphagnum jensenii]|uniref:glycerol-3-phosphate dehydrogenase n=1 Tax=Sphagnum jensenii TaxID=128206 RepID=A0ABP1B0W3_9BRYO